MNQSMWADAPSQPPTHEKVQLQAAVTTPLSSSSLSASAHAFAPPPPDAALDVSSADSFAPTGPQQDHLFDDVVPEEESMRIRSDDDLFSDDFTPAPQPIVEQQQQPVVQTREPPAAPRGIGRGGGRGRSGREPRMGDPQTSGRPPQNNHNHNNNPQNPNDRSQTPSAGAPENAPTGPRKETTRSVRGDRQATGGVRKPKLTEEELAEKMARISIKNASLTAAHARAEADAASFAQREQQAKQVADQRRKEERRDRQQMMGEREKNRLRKLKAMEGREWDAEKRERDFDRDGQFDKKGAFSGDRAEYTDGREYLYREPGRTGERGPHVGAATKQAAAAAAAAPNPDEFPALPATKSPLPGAGLDDHREDTKPSEKSWADQVESSTASG